MMPQKKDKLTILCVEDEEALREDLREELEDAGYEVFEGVDGEDGLKQVAKYRPDLVISDITMPNLSGHGLIEKVRSHHPELADTPFIFLSALADREHVLKGMNVGADDYLTKPIDYDMLLAKVSAHLRQTKRMEVKKRQEHIKIYKALTAKAQEAVRSKEVEKKEPEDEFVWKATIPRSVALVGQSDDSMWDVQQLLRKAGHTVTIFTSGRAYLNKFHATKPDLTCLWPDTDDVTASGVTKMIDKSSSNHILVYTTKTSAKAAKIKREDSKSLLKADFNVQISNEELVEKLSPWI